MKIEIRSRFHGDVLFSLETSSLKLAVEAAVKGRANLYGANLYWADLGEANLGRANLYGANLYGANLGRANLYGADLGRANLYGANLYGADLGRANLYGANLYGANLYGADLGRANLYGANLYGANLYGADLGRANLYGATDLTKARCTPLLMLLDQPGKIRAYKIVHPDGQGPYNGGITFTVGQSYAVANANTDDTKDCGAGINLATLDWCLKNYQCGYRLLVAEFTAKDIAAIPIATDGKFRVHRCKIVAEQTERITKLLAEEQKAMAAAKKTATARA